MTIDSLKLLLKHLRHLIQKFAIVPRRIVFRIFWIRHYAFGLFIVQTSVVSKLFTKNFSRFTCGIKNRNWMDEKFFTKRSRIIEALDTLTLATKITTINKTPMRPSLISQCYKWRSRTRVCYSNSDPKWRLRRNTSTVYNLNRKSIAVNDNTCCHSI